MTNVNPNQFSLARAMSINGPRVKRQFPVSNRVPRLASYVLWAVGSGMLSAACLAGPVVAEHLSSDARWFGHVNVESIRSIPGFTEDVQRWCSQTNAQAGLSEWSGKLGLDPVKDLLGITIYSAQYTNGHILALLYVRKVDQEKMLSSLKERYPERTTSLYGARTLYSWTARHPRGEMPMTGAFASDQLIVIGKDAEEVKAALDVVDGKRPGLTTSSPLLAGVSPQAIFVSKGVDVSADDRARTRCPVLRNCEAASVQWSQQDGVLTAAYRLAATSEEAAQAYQTVVAGFKALAGLRSQDSPAMSGLLQGLTYRADGKVFTANWEAKVQAVREAMEQMKQSGGRCPLAH